MDIAGKGLMPHVDPLVEEIKRLDLTENVMELEAYGFTVIPPAKTGISAKWIRRLRDAIIGTVDYVGPFAGMVVPRRADVQRVA